MPVVPVSVVVPVFGAASALARCLESLRLHLPPACEVIVADDATPDTSVSDIASSFASGLRLTYVRRSENLGFVENCNEAMRSILPSGNDVLLLNSDTEVTEGFLEEMRHVLHLHEKHGAVSPRSNNATILSVPPSVRLPPEESYQLWKSVRPLLPRYQVVPTIVGFCILIKNAVLRQLGLFDSVYSPGYNEENDFICRINRCGYSAVVAHQAFVFHYESASFGGRRERLEGRNRQILDDRYPEYSRKVGEHLRYAMDPVDHFSILWRAHRKTVLYDLTHLPATHSGTSDFALNLLLHLAPLIESEYELRLLLSDEARRFFAGELTGYRFFDAARDHALRFDLVYKPAHIFTWPELVRMVRLGGRIAFTQLDIIAVRCDYLASPSTRALFRTAAQLADRVMTISEFSKSDFQAYYGISVPFEVIHLGTAEGPKPPGFSRGYVLVVGNRFHHKAVDRTVAELRGIAEVVALGGSQGEIGRGRILPSGKLSRSAIAELYDRASVVVYPSFYEGFGIPIVDAIAKGIPVVALDTEVNQEVRSLTGSSSLFLAKDHEEMRSLVSALIKAPAEPVRSSAPRAWTDVACDYARSFNDLLAGELDVDRIRRRWELLTVIDAVHPLA